MLEFAPRVKIFRVIKMKLDSATDRLKILDGLIKKSLKLDELFLHDEENTDDWVANMEILRHLFSINDFILTEKIFFDTLDEMGNVRTRNVEEKEIYTEIVSENMEHFVDTLLLREIEYSLDELNRWQFKSEVGQKFHKDVSKKLNLLMKKYLDYYDL